MKKTVFVLFPLLAVSALGLAGCNSSADDGGQTPAPVAGGVTANAPTQNQPPPEAQQRQSQAATEAQQRANAQGQAMMENMRKGQGGGGGR